VSAPPGTPYSWEQLPEAIKALKDGQDIDYQGASGSIDMDDAGDATAGVYDIYQFKGADLGVIGEQPVVNPNQP
jgi:branched-chain amino acid transport system substrate-binding protein